MRLAIVGTGLIGASIGLAARRTEAAGAIVGYDADPQAAGAALAVVAAPIAQAAAQVAATLDASGEETTVTNVASTKASVAAAAAGSPRFIGGHPICGSEARGPEHASAGLFDGATWF